MAGPSPPPALYSICGSKYHQTIDCRDSAISLVVDHLWSTGWVIGPLSSAGDCGGCDGQGASEMARRKAAMKKLGFLSSAASPRELADPVAAFRSGMKSGGFVEGENVKVIYQWPNYDFSQLPDLAT